MEITEARAIVKSLAKGIDPLTGEVFEKHSPYNHPQVIRALFTIQDACSRIRGATRTPEERRKENVASGRPGNAGLPWTDDDRKKAASDFKKGSSIASLARSLQRTQYAIQSELIRQGLIEANADSPGRRS